MTRNEYLALVAAIEAGDDAAILAFERKRKEEEIRGFTGNLLDPTSVLTERLYTVRKIAGYEAASAARAIAAELKRRGASYRPEKTRFRHRAMIGR